MAYQIRLTSFEDINAVKAIYEHARTIMRRSGNLSQWVNGYPQDETIKEDIVLKQSYVIEKDNKIIATFVFFVGNEPTYNDIEGRWLNDAPYGVIHRIGSLEIEKGILQICLDYCLEKIDNIRIDTHKDNVIMRHLLTKYGFQECGTIYLTDGSPRLAYQFIKKQS